MQSLNLLAVCRTQVDPPERANLSPVIITYTRTGFASSLTLNINKESFQYYWCMIPHAGEWAVGPPHCETVPFANRFHNT